MSNFNAYAIMQYCPMCGTKLTVVETPIDNVKDCATDLQHTVALYHYADMMQEMHKAYLADRSSVRQTELEQFGEVLADANVVPSAAMLKNHQQFLHDWDVTLRHGIHRSAQSMTLDEIWIAHKTGRMTLEQARRRAGLDERT